MILEVRRKEFEINFVNNYVHEKYTEMLELVDILSAQPDIIEDLAVEGQKKKDEAEDSGDKKEIEKHYKAEIQKLSQEVYRVRKDILKIRTEIVQEILESNDIEYDSNFWNKKVSRDDINDFFLECVRKDFDSSVKKKESRTKK